MRIEQVKPLQQGFPKASVDNCAMSQILGIVTRLLAALQRARGIDSAHTTKRSWSFFLPPSRPGPRVAGSTLGMVGLASCPGNNRILSGAQLQGGGGATTRLCSAAQAILVIVGCPPSQAEIEEERAMGIWTCVVGFDRLR